MIDFDQFWAEAGCFPGMSKKESEAYLQQLAAHFGQPGQIPFDAAYNSILNPGPGVTADQIGAWESQHGVRLPDVLRQAFTQQDGGFVGEGQLRILPLGEIALPEPD